MTARNVMLVTIRPASAYTPIGEYTVCFVEAYAQCDEPAWF